MDSNDKSKDFLMQELLKLKLSLRHELNRVTQIIDHLNPDQEAVPPLKDVSIHNELLDDNDIFSLVKLQMQQKISKPSYEAWMKDVYFSFIESDQMTLVAPNVFARDWLEERYAELIKFLLKSINGKDSTIRFITK
ncbi:DnaA N-terminal domain-containing protein [Peribacillus simplex]|uniref:DnaA N-terminal domain-containing protein n=1 Tax=Peribacillus simplex TaxID=1478 RepID=UPI00298DAAA5|nr:DnaA N-terminal domain-containing protein [Peribacillus simplex]MDW7614970.1 DnaA N-terminal domain-containing protein [Peribacillus simplex]